MLYGSREHIAERARALPGFPGFAEVVERFGCEQTAEWLAEEGLKHALGMGMPPSVDEWYDHPESNP